MMPGDADKAMLEGQGCMPQEEPEEELSRKLIQVHSHLSHLLSPKYLRLAFTLPPTCTSIWSLMEDDIDRLAQIVPEPCAKNIQEVLHFMENFFARGLVHRMSHNFELLEGSYLGLQYTLRLGLAGLCEGIIDNLIDSHVCKEGGPLYNFMGACEGQIPASIMGQLASSDRDWETPKKTFRSKQGGGTSGAGVGGGGGAGRGRGGDGGATGGAGGGGADGGEGSSGSGHGDGDEGSIGGGGVDGDEENFDPTGLLNNSMVVELSEFKTPTKGQPGRQDAILVRSSEFAEHGSIEKPPHFYDPWVVAEIQNKVFLYHGTRSGNLRSFKEEGINPRVKRNEFYRLPAFYTTNSLRYAYEHPLHNHPCEKMDPVSVLVFQVDARVLHGECSAPGMAAPFSVKWFKADTKENIAEWADFCLKNLKRKLKAHNFDIVIGPVCLPNPAKDQVDKLSRFLGDGAELTQIAFCSMSTLQWLERSGMKVCPQVQTLQLYRELDHLPQVSQS